MSQISDISSWATADVLKRTDIDTMAQDAALAAYKSVVYCVPFDEMMVTSNEIPTVAWQKPGDEVYSLANLIPALKFIRSIRFSNSTNNRRRLRKSDTRVYDSLAFTQASSIPSTYARFGLNIELNPPPNSSTYTFRIRYYQKVTVANPIANTVIQTPDEWDELLKYETLYRILYNLGQSERAQALITPQAIPRQSSPRKQRMYEVGILPRLWNDLLGTTSQRENIDEDFNINPLVRAYSYRGK